jgi:hypothetical protein
MNNELSANESSIRTAVLAVLGREPSVTIEQIRSMVDRMLQIVSKDGVDSEKIVRNIEVCLNVKIDGGGGALGDDSDHIDWLGLKRPNIKWGYWERYKHWLRFVKGMPPKVLDELEDSTEEVLGRLEDPYRPGQWDRRGMVVGHVQSGKTGHYTGLICKAVDSGYRLVVVLAGLDNGLRSQTQLRIDEGFLGFTMGNGAGRHQGSHVGVGLIPEFAHAGLTPISLTTAAEVGDFRRNLATGLGIIPGGQQPLVLVVKKNKSVMENLLNWVGAIVGSDRDGVHKIPNIPILVIDDECDHASVNTKKTIYDFARGGVDGEPTAINGLIRRLLHMFDQSSYVGYTATPFANIFIYHKDGLENRIFGDDGIEKKFFGEDLFPRSFIICLARSSEYLGADRVFGLRDSVLQGISATRGLPILRPVADLDAYIPPSHDRNWTVPDSPVPASLRRAMLSFVLVCAARRARGQGNDHNSMLLHLSRLQDVQTEIFSVIEHAVNGIKRAIRNATPNDSRPVLDELKSIWESDFLETTLLFDDPRLPAISWFELQQHLEAAAEKIKVKVINGRSEDALDYYNNRNHGISVIAIGGAKLSRGLTLEGLSVSYFQRTTKMYDTLMQMGRWFGYRNGYADLCRLYTTDELIGWYRDIAMATEELYNQFDEMRALGATPKEFGLRVAKSPENLLVTARVKMRNTTTLKLSYAGTNPSYRALRSSNVSASIAATRKLAQWALANATPRQDSTPNHVFQGLSVDGVLSFLKDFPAFPGVASADPNLLKKYVEACTVIGELTSWTVAFISLTDPKAKQISFEGLSLRLAKRAGRPKVGDKNADPIIGTLWDPAHEGLGLSLEELTHMKTRAAIRNVVVPEPPRGAHYRLGRLPNHGLLVLYFLDPAGLDENNAIPRGFEAVEYIPTFAMSFPHSAKAPGVDYIVKNDFWTDADEEEEGT